MIERPVSAERLTMTRRNFLTVPLALCASASTLPSLAQTPELDGGVLRVGVLTHYKPFSLLKAICRGLMSKCSNAWHPS